MRTCDCTVVTATTDTTEVSIGTVTLPSNAKRIVGVGVNLDHMGLTTLEGNSGMFRVQINNLDVSPAKFPIAGDAIVGSVSATHHPLHIFPVDWSPAGNSVVTFYVTMDSANTVVVNARGYVLYDK